MPLPLLRPVRDGLVDFVGWLLLVRPLPLLQPLTSRLRSGSQRLLEAEQLSYKVKPVRDYGDLGDIYIEHIVDGVEVRATP